MLTTKVLEELPPNSIFATGVMRDVEDGLFMADTGEELRWVAVRGGIADWAIYCGFSTKSEEWVSRHGDKVCGKVHIQRCVPCDEEAFQRYRY